MLEKPNRKPKHLSGIIKIKQLVAFILIVTMSLPQMMFGTMLAANESTESPWLNLPEISPYDLDFSHLDDFTLFDFTEIENYNELRLQSLLQRMNEFSSFTAEEQAIVMAHQGIDSIIPLAELLPEELEGFLREQEEYLSQDWYTRETTEFIALLREESSFSALSDDDRSLIFRRLDIAYDALPITEALFTIMEQDGYSLNDSMILTNIIATGLFDYIEAQAILELIPSPTERTMELVLFEQFAEKFDIAEEISERRLLNLQFKPTNVFDRCGSDANDYEAIGSNEINVFYELNGFNETNQLQPSRELVDISRILSANRPSGIHRFFDDSNENNNQEWALQQPPQSVEQPPQPEEPPCQQEECSSQSEEQPDYADETPSEYNEYASEENELPENGDQSFETALETVNEYNEHMEPLDGYPEPSNTASQMYSSALYSSENEMQSLEPEDSEQSHGYETYEQSDESYLSDQPIQQPNDPSTEEQQRDLSTRFGLNNALQTKPWARLNQGIGLNTYTYTNWSTEDLDTVTAIFDAFTSADAFNVARQMLLNNHTAAEIEAALAL